MRSKTTSHAKMLHREGFPSSVSAILPLMGHCAVHHAVTFLTFCTAAEVFRLKHASCSASLSVTTMLCLGFLAFLSIIEFSQVYYVDKTFLLRC